MSNSSGSRNRKLVPEARYALEKFKYEAADEVGVHVPENDYWGDMTSRECGSVGGQMVKRMIEMAEEELMRRS
ncbi:MAG: alpha/beta-type small acid-soluble spore protein [Bacillota bacterium]|nr:alpha/beta-type small acid-soluble spore protein [Bacillota bacterium]